MSYSKRLLEGAGGVALIAAFALTACTDPSGGPTALDSDGVEGLTISADFSSVFDELTSGAFSEKLYLTDSGLQGTSDNGSLLYLVELDDGASTANLSLLADLEGETAGCSDCFDRTDAIAADGNTVWIIDKFSKHLGVYDGDTDTFTDEGEIPGLPNGVVQASFDPAFTNLVVSSDVTDDLHVIDLSGPTVSSTIDLDDGFDMLGADIVFDADGVLYIFTNGGDGTNGRGLYRVDDYLAGGTITPTWVGEPSIEFFTGMAIREALTGRLVASTHSVDDDGDRATTGTAVQSRVYAFNRTTPFAVEGFDTKLGGSDYYVGFGDMSVGFVFEADGCTYTQGFWRNHAGQERGRSGRAAPNAWPYESSSEGDPAPDTEFFLSGDTWLEVLETPTRGNGYYVLAHQYIAAALNLLKHDPAPLPESVQEAIELAEDFFQNYGVEDGGDRWDPDSDLPGTSSTFSELAEILDSYNNGEMEGVTHCDDMES